MGVCLAEQKLDRILQNEKILLRKISSLVSKVENFENNQKEILQKLEWLYIQCVPVEKLSETKCNSNK